MADAGGGRGGDPYGGAKANLRDSIKWLVAVFSALAAVVLGSTPLTGLRSAALPEGDRFWGAVALGVCFLAICGAIVILIRLLRSDLLYITDIDPRVDLDKDEAKKDLSKAEKREIAAIRADMALHVRDLLTDAEYKTIEELFVRLDRATDLALSSRQALKDAHKEGKPASDIASLQAAYERDAGVVGSFRATQGELQTYASYTRFYGRLKAALWPLLGLGVLALVALFAFTFITKAPAKDDQPTIIVIHIPGGDPKPPVEGEILGTVYFDTNLSLIDEAGRATVEKARDALLAKPDTALLIIARTDTVGSEARNASLARERAGAVRTLVVARGGIAASRVFATEVPKSDLPQVTGDAIDSRANRSASLYLVPLKRP